MVIQYIDGMPVRLAAPFDLSCLAAYGRVFRVFDDQDSGNLCFGMDDGTAQRFLKIAGAQTVRSVATPEEAIARMKHTVPVYTALAHPYPLQFAGSQGYSRRLPHGIRLV